MMLGVIWGMFQFLWIVHGNLNECEILSIQLIPINGMYLKYNDHPNHWKDVVAKMEVK